MADLIDRAALLAEGNVRKMKDALEDWDTLDNKTKITVLRYAKAHKKLVESVPAVDAVEVVRCKDCKHFRPCEELEGVSWTGWCMYGQFHTDEDDFCSRGERRTDATG